MKAAAPIRGWIQDVPKALPEICHDRRPQGFLLIVCRKLIWHETQAPRFSTPLLQRKSSTRWYIYSCKNLYLDPPRVLNFSPTRSVVGVFFWRTNFTPDWRIWAYKHLSWSSWLASLFGPRCTVFFVIYERLLRILVEADQILSVICLTYIHPLHIPIVSMGHHGYMFTIPPGSVAFLNWDPGIETWDPFSTLQALQAFA